MARSSSGRLDHSTADDGELLPCAMLPTEIMCVDLRADCRLIN
jgi:hypothetical protein